MPNRFSIEQIRDQGPFSEDEAKATWKSTKVDEDFPVSIDTVDGTNNQVTITGADLKNLQLLPDDVVEITNNSAAGTYTVASIDSETTFTVNEDLVDASGGSVTAYNPVGATKLGVDNRTWGQLTGSTAQAALNDLDTKSGRSENWNTRGLVNLPGNEIYRFDQFKIPSGQTLKVVQAGIQRDDQTTLTNLEVQLYDLTNSAILYQTDDDDQGSPLIEASGSLDIAMRLSNQTSKTHQVSAYFQGLLQ